MDPIYKLTCMTIVMASAAWSCSSTPGTPGTEAIGKVTSPLLTSGGVLIQSDTNTSLSMNAYGGAHAGAEVRLWQNCPKSNPDCTWIYRKGMILSASNPSLAIRGGPNLTTLTLSNTCTPTDQDCEWTWSQGGFYSARDNTLMINAYGGAAHKGQLKVNTACTLTNPDCTWTIPNAPISSETDSTLGINATGGAREGTALKLYSNCPSSNTDCTWTFTKGQIASDTNSALRVAPVGGANSGAVMDLTGSCSPSNANCSWFASQGEVFSWSALLAQQILAANAFGGAAPGTTIKLNGACTGLNTDCLFDIGYAADRAVAFPTAVATQGDQAETALAFSYASSADSIQLVAYNDKSGVDGVNGFDIFGYAIFDPANSTSWVNHKVPLPTTKCGTSPCWIQLWGDPAAIGNPFDKNYVYAYNMASSKDVVQTSDLDSFCVARWTDRGRTYPPPLECHKSTGNPPGDGVPGHLLDGSGMAASPANGMVVLGYHDVGANPSVNQTDDQVDLWYTCDFSTNTCGPSMPFVKGTGVWVPFPGQVCTGHPRISIDPYGFVYVIEELDGGKLVYNAATYAGFPSTPQTIEAHLNHGASFTVPKTHSVVNAKQAGFYSIAAGINESGNPEARIAYTQYDGSHYHIQYVSCGGTTCTRVPTWDTGASSSPHGAHDELFPAVSYANGTWKVAYLSTWADASQLGVAYQTLSGDGTSRYPRASDPPHALTQFTNANCPAGDYNDMKYNATRNEFIYAYDVPSGGTCGQPATVTEASIPAH